MSTEHTPPAWPDDVDSILAGDLAAALTVITPAGGAVASAMAPVGLRDRDEGWTGFTTSIGFNKKLERIKLEPRVSVAYHTRLFGRATSPRYVLVQGRAEVIPDPDDALAQLIFDQATGFLGDIRRGRFWDAWMKEYYVVRVPVKVHAERVTVWPDLACAGTPEVIGAAAVGPPPAQQPPGKGTGPRLDSAKAVRRCAAKPHQLLAFRGADGFPVTLPVTIGAGGPDGIRLTAAPGLIPPGGRRAGLLAHVYRPNLVGLSTRYLTGWLTPDPDGTGALYAPHTERGLAVPPNKTLLLLANGLTAKLGVRKVLREGRVDELPKGFQASV
jgi:hypothetical protein